MQRRHFVSRPPLLSTVRARLRGFRRNLSSSIPCLSSTSTAAAMSLGSFLQASSLQVALLTERLISMRVLFITALLQVYRFIFRPLCTCLCSVFGIRFTPRALAAANSPLASSCVFAWVSLRFVLMLCTKLLREATVIFAVVSILVCARFGLSAW